MKRNFYLHTDNSRIDKAFDLISKSIYHEADDGNYYIEKDVLHTHNNEIEEEKNIIDVLIFHGIIADFGPAYPGNPDDIENRFVLLQSGKHFRTKEEDFKKWLENNEKIRSESDEDKKADINRPAMITNQGALLATGVMLVGLFLIDLVMEWCFPNVQQINVEPIIEQHHNQYHLINSSQSDIEPKVRESFNLPYGVQGIDFNKMNWE